MSSPFLLLLLSLLAFLLLHIILIQDNSTSPFHAVRLCHRRRLPVPPITHVRVHAARLCARRERTRARGSCGVSRREWIFFLCLGRAVFLEGRTRAVMRARRVLNLASRAGSRAVRVVRT
ncbi:hypothetical protein B0H10DRAFT_2092146, partial [Mycena sp. CBHHK59/15]